jgi:hypothetical protein
MISAGAVVLMSATLTASSSIPIELSQRFRGAHRAVVATVVAVEPQFQRNRFGDDLIVSRIRVAIEESLKGDNSGELWVDVEGGTVGDLTLRVSDLPLMGVGERVVFLVDEDSTSGRFTPHLRGQGILKLDTSDRVRGTALTLGQIRAIARQAGR